MGLQRTYPSHKDSFGFLGTALVGVTTWTPAQFRSTGVVLNEIAKGDVFSYNIQLNHDKKLQSALDGFHIHFIPMTNNSGNVNITYRWGIYHSGDVIPDVLPNTATINLAIDAEQYKHKRGNVIPSMAIPGTETYSSFVLVHCVRNNNENDTFTGNIALLGADVHYITDRTGSLTEGTD